MARKKKSDLIEEAHQLGLPAHEDEHYDDIMNRVKDARDDQEVSGEDDQGAEIELVEDYHGEPDDAWMPEVFIEERPEPKKSRPGYNSLGVWVGGGRPQ